MTKTSNSSVTSFNSIMIWLPIIILFSLLVLVSQVNTSKSSVKVVNNNGKSIVLNKRKRCKGKKNNVKILLVIMSCSKNRGLWEKLKNIDSRSIIFYGNPKQQDEYFLNEQILSLKCGDTYDHLPHKILLMIKAITNLTIFSDVTHIFKIDDHDTKFDQNTIDNITNIKNISCLHYGGQRLQHYEFYNKLVKFPRGGNRRFHFNKCPVDSYWNNKLYEGPYTTWADGGCGYILSRKSMNFITEYYNSHQDEILKNHIYEDVMIAVILFHHHILGTKIPKIIKGDK